MTIQKSVILCLEFLMKDPHNQSTLLHGMLK